MKFLRNYGGIILIFIGVLTLVALYVFHITSINALLLVPLFFIITGVVLYVYGLKKQSLY